MLNALTCKVQSAFDKRIDWGVVISLNHQPGSRAICSCFIEPTVSKATKWDTKTAHNGAKRTIRCASKHMFMQPRALRTSGMPDEALVLPQHSNTTSASYWPVSSITCLRSDVSAETSTPLILPAAELQHSSTPTQKLAATIYWALDNMRNAPAFNTRAQRDQRCAEQQ